jgi:hypothetical protein
MVTIKRITGTVIASYDVSTLREALIKAVAEEANLFDANLRDANLSGANLRGANLIGANLSGAYLRDANLSGANLSGANLRGANLRGANLISANLRGANLIGANLRGADLRASDILLSGELIVLPVGDYRGYSSVALWVDNEWRIYAGCRHFNITEARAHWGEQYKGDRMLGDQYLAAMDWLEKQPQPKERNDESI